MHLHRKHQEEEAAAQRKLAEQQQQTPKGEHGGVTQTNPLFDNNITVGESFTGNGTTIEIQEYNSLGQWMLDPQYVYFMTQTGRKYKRPKVVLNGGDFRAETGALHYMTGNVEVDVEVSGAGGLAKRFIKAALNDTTTIKPRYFGHGDVYLVPTWAYYALTQLKDQEAVVDNGMYLASKGSVTVGVTTSKSVRTALFGGTGLFQTKLSGTGWVLLQLPVPVREVQKFTLNHDCLKVEGDAAVVRIGNIEYTLKRAVKSLAKAIASDEACLHCYRGTGEVWLLPTASCWETTAP